MGRGSLCLSSSMRARPTLGWPKFTFHRIAMDARFSTHPFRSNLRLNFRRLAPLNVSLASTTEFQICLLARRRPTDLLRRVYDTTSHDSVSRRYSDKQFSFLPLNIGNNEEESDLVVLEILFLFCFLFSNDRRIDKTWTSCADLYGYFFARKISFGLLFTVQRVAR